MSCIREYRGKMHLVYGERDRYVDKRDIKELIKIVKEKEQPVKILKDQDHSPWEYDVAQEVYEEETKFLDKYL